MFLDEVESSNADENYMYLEMSLLIYLHIGSEMVYVL